MDKDSWLDEGLAHFDGNFIVLADRMALLFVDSNGLIRQDCCDLKSGFITISLVVSSSELGSLIEDVICPGLLP